MRDWLDELGLREQLPEAIFLDMATERAEPIDLALIGVDDEVTAMLAASREAMCLIASSMPAKRFFLESQRRGFQAGAIVSPDEAFEDEHSVSRGFQVDVVHDELDRTIRYPGRPYRFSGGDVPAPRRPPLVGEHTAELLGGSGGSDADG
jgi:hypothetical protein